MFIGRGAGPRSEWSRYCKKVSAVAGQLEAEDSYAPRRKPGYRCTAHPHRGSMHGHFPRAGQPLRRNRPVHHAADPAELPCHTVRIPLPLLFPRPLFASSAPPRRWPLLHSTKVWEVQMLLRRSGSCQSKQFCLEMLRGTKPLRTKHLCSACSSFSAHKGLPAKTRRIHGSVGVFLFSVLRCALAPPPFGKWRFSPPRRR